MTTTVPLCEKCAPLLQRVNLDTFPRLRAKLCKKCRAQLELARTSRNEGREYPCPWCEGGRIVWNAARLESMHSLPACARYLAEVTKGGAQHRGFDVELPKR